MQRWHFFHVKAGSTILTLKLLHTLPAGTYDLHWKATSDVDEGRPAEDHDDPRRRDERSRSQNVVSISGGRTTQGVTHGLKHVSRLTPDQAFLYATYHDVRRDPRRRRPVRAARSRATCTRCSRRRRVVALSKNGGRRAALKSKGIVAVPASTPPAQLAALVARLLQRLARYRSPPGFQSGSSPPAFAARARMKSRSLSRFR